MDIKTQRKIRILLTQRELEIACLAWLPDEEIARRLCLSPVTVRAHFKRIRRKLGVHTKREIFALLFPERLGPAPLERCSRRS